MRCTWWTLLITAACQTSLEVPETPDAAPDAPPVPVVALDSCPASVAVTIMDSPTMFIPKTSTITIGQVVKFVITSEHYVIPNPLKTTDDALMIGRGQTKCFRFNVAGSYNFLCGVHSFPGEIIVQ
jgi:plastocyanin